MANPILHIFKIGGNVIDKDADLNNFLNNFSAFHGPKILVHGGGKIATELAAQMGVQAKMVNGRRITDPEMLKIVTMVYGGLVNKSITAKLQAINTNAIGLSGMDGQIILSKKRNPIPIDYGMVGDIESVNKDFLTSLLNQGLIPVIAPLTSNKEGEILNTNADTIAQALAVALSNLFQVNLIYCFEKNGVLSNPQDDESVINSINSESYQDYKNKGIITDGMIPKLDNAFQALREGVRSVRICSSKNLSKGTIIQLS